MLQTSTKKNIKKAVIFTAVLLPFVMIGAYLSVGELLESYPDDIKQQIISQMGSLEAMTPIFVIQYSMYSVFCGIVGYLLSVKIGLMKPMKIEKRPAFVTLAFGTVTALLLLSDLFIFNRFIPELSASYESYKNGIPIDKLLKLIVGNALLGGIAEELMLRLFFMSLTVLIIKVVFFRKRTEYSNAIYITANVIAALLFAAGHLPATSQLFSGLTPMLIVRCFALNGIAGLGFGYLFRKYGIQYSIAAHGLAHVISKALFAIIL